MIDIKFSLSSKAVVEETSFDSGEDLTTIVCNELQSLTGDTEEISRVFIEEGKPKVKLESVGGVKVKREIYCLVDDKGNKDFYYPYGWRDVIKMTNNGVNNPKFVKLDFNSKLKKLKSKEVDETMSIQIAFICEQIIPKRGNFLSFLNYQKRDRGVF